MKNLMNLSIGDYVFFEKYEGKVIQLQKQQVAVAPFFYGLKYFLQEPFSVREEVASDDLPEYDNDSEDKRPVNTVIKDLGGVQVKMRTPHYVFNVGYTGEVFTQSIYELQNEADETGKILAEITGTELKVYVNGPDAEPVTATLNETDSDADGISDEDFYPVLNIFRELYNNGECLSLLTILNTAIYKGMNSSVNQFFEDVLSWSVSELHAALETLDLGPITGYEYSLDIAGATPDTINEHLFYFDLSPEKFQELKDAAAKWETLPICTVA